ncbi:ADP-ribosylglycohydrolase family protein [Gordonia crocea]|uniref:Ribosylglycohydrolase n=1 Tax=Gordonia crocea TaxID=589162 RepID=A0A7M4BQ67_9ACTN|nr:ADP-ribosylglycohydrolase family protein [Gordonia crocea]GED96028.1 ribosylglycohydrolase [Gordonia crocea]
MTLTPAQLDRACGAVLGSAVGDALGAGYEFESAPLGPDGPQMIGGGLGHFAPGEWTDDTTMAWCILDVAASGLDLRSPAGRTAVARRFRDWYESGPADIGIQTSGVLRIAGPAPTGESLTATAYDFHASTGRTAGNGSLMRTAAVALPYLHDEIAVVDAARTISALTHYDPRAQQACVLWSLAIRRAIVDGELDLRAGVAHLDDEAVAYWTERIDEAESSSPRRFNPNGWVVSALQAAWSAIVHTPIPHDQPCRQFAAALNTAIRIGNDTDTVAAIAGALLGARWGASAVPARWRRILHGYPGLTGEQLVALAHLAATGGAEKHGWPTTTRIEYPGAAGILVRHPHDDGVWLGDVAALDRLPSSVSAVVSLCLVGTEQVPVGVEHIPFRLIDEPDPAVNPNLDFLLADAAAIVTALRDEGREVLIHCVHAHSRTPAVAIAYALSRGATLDAAVDAVRQVLPEANPNAGFRAALRSLHDVRPAT